MVRPRKELDVVQIFRAPRILTLEQLCRTYWYPLYAFVRFSGYPPDDAQDQQILPQGVAVQIHGNSIDLRPSIAGPGSWLGEGSRGAREGVDASADSTAASRPAPWGRSAQEQRRRAHEHSEDHLYED